MSSLSACAVLLGRGDGGQGRWMQTAVCMCSWKFYCTAVACKGRCSAARWNFLMMRLLLSLGVMGQIFEFQLLMIWFLVIVWTWSYLICYGQGASTVFSMGYVAGEMGMTGHWVEFYSSLCLETLNYMISACKSDFLRCTSMDIYSKRWSFFPSSFCFKVTIYHFFKVRYRFSFFKQRNILALMVEYLEPLIPHG